MREEKEVSSGAVIGWILLGVAVTLVLAFVAFAVFKKVNNKDVIQSDNQVQIESTVESMEEPEE